MKPSVSIRVFISLAVLVGAALPFSGTAHNQMAHRGDIHIDIYAGVYGHTGGNAGLGWVIYVHNNGSSTVQVTYEIRWDTLRGTTVREEGLTFNVTPHMDTCVAGVEWIHFPFPILRIAISVQTQNITVSRNGVEIFPFVIFPPKV